MAAVSDHSDTQNHDLADAVLESPERASSARRAIASCAGGALYMAALGIWLVPAEDSAMQLIKLVASCVMVAAGAFLFHGVSARAREPEVQVDLITRQLRVYEYDNRGRAVLKACHEMDDLQELSLRKDRLRARDEQGDLMVDVEIGEDEGKQLLRALKGR
ncbi:MAG: hypothetical protein AAFN80_12020 [Pseudomonadota bacterium]